MSYEIGIGDDDFNYTYNLGEFFHDFIKHFDNDFNELTGWQGLDGMVGRDAAPILLDALSNISSVKRQNQPLYLSLGKKYDPDNYWGDVMSASILMARVMAACYRNPDAKLSVT